MMRLFQASPTTRERIEPDELEDQGWVVGSRSGDAPEFGAWPGIAEPRITFIARDWLTRLALVVAGLGIALVPGIAAQAMPGGVRWIPIHDDTGGLRRAVWAATNDNPSAAVTAMVHALEEEAKEQICDRRRAGRAVGRMMVDNEAAPRRSPALPAHQPVQTPGAGAPGRDVRRP